ncbi:MAG: ankyrin repeat domain-containing protein [Gammaproteobacteria bacterium]
MKGIFRETLKVMAFLLLLGGFYFLEYIKKPLPSMHRAAAGGDGAEIIRLIDGEANVNAKANDDWRFWHNDSRTALHFAVRKGETAAALVLVKAGADIEAKDNNDGTPLHYAAWYGNTKTALALVKAGADIEAKDNNGGTPLHWAASRLYTETALALVKACADINARNNIGATPLHVAAQVGQTETAHALVKAGASLLAETDDNETPLDVAIEEHGKDSVIALFLQKTMVKKGLTNEEKAKKLVRDLDKSSNKKQWIAGVRSPPTRECH